jgi:hypothetical protein
VRTLAVLGSLAGLAVVLATATRGGESHAWPVGWTGYVPLGESTRLVCKPSAETGTIVVHAKAGSGFFMRLSTVPVAREGSGQIVCRPAAAP